MTTETPVTTTGTTTSETTTSEPPAPEVTEGTTTKYSISDPDYNPNDLPGLGGVLDDDTKNLVEQHKVSCRYGCGEQHSGYLIHSVFGGECPHCGENITANVCHDCVRDGHTPAW